MNNNISFEDLNSGDNYVIINPITLEEKLEEMNILIKKQNSEFKKIIEEEIIFKLDNLEKKYKRFSYIEYLYIPICILISYMYLRKK